MSATALTKRYAKALLEIGVEKNAVDQLGEEIAGVAGIFAENDLLRQLMESPTLVQEKKAGMMSDLLAKASISPEGTNFLGLLLAKGRIKYLGQIAAEYRAFADERSGKIRAQVTTAAPLDEQQATKIKTDLEKLTGKSIMLDTAVDAALLGGIKAEFAGKVFDGSLKTQLNKISNTLQKG